MGLLENVIEFRKLSVAAFNFPFLVGSLLDGNNEIGSGFPTFKKLFIARD